MKHTGKVLFAGFTLTVLGPLVGSSPLAAAQSPWRVKVVGASLGNYWTPDSVNSPFKIKAEAGSKLAILSLEVTALHGNSGNLATRLAPFSAELGPDVTQFLTGKMPDKWSKMAVMQLFSYPKELEKPSQVFISTKCVLKLPDGQPVTPIGVHANNSAIVSFIKAPAILFSDEPVMLLYRQEKLAAGLIFLNKKVELTLVYSIPAATTTASFTFANFASQTVNLKSEGE